jgi:hypothetical protein
MEQIAGLVIKQVLGSLLYLGVIIAGIAVSFSRRRTYPRVCYLTSSALLLLLVLRVSTIALIARLSLGTDPQPRYDHPLFRLYMEYGPLTYSTLSAIALFLLLVAVFIDRGETAGGTRGETVV